MEINDSKRQKVDSDFTIIPLDEVKKELFVLLGSGKFKTPRMLDMTVPVIIFPKFQVFSIDTFDEKIFISLKVDRNAFTTMQDWLDSVTENSNEIVRENNTVRIKIVHPIQLFNDIGEEVDIYTIANHTLQCAVELACVWCNTQQSGLSMNLIEGKVSKECLISDDVEDIHSVSLNIQPSYVPF